MCNDCIQEQAKLNADWIFLSLLIIKNGEACVFLFFKRIKNIKKRYLKGSRSLKKRK